MIACGFSPSGDGSGGDGGGADGSGATDGGDGDAGPERPFCDRDEPLLRLCVTFQDGGVIDSSASGVPFTVEDLGFGPGIVDDAVQLTPTSVIHGDEHLGLDLTTALTMEAFVNVASSPSPAPRAGIIDNNNQYGMWVSANMRPYCTVGSTTVSGPTIADGTWTHVACVFDNLTYRIFVDGALFGTVNRQVPAPITGVDGTNLGQDCTAGGSGDPLTGRLDEVRIWASARSAEQIAAAAARRGG